MKYPIYSSEVFRSPSDTERAIGLWVDRIGRAENSSKRPGKLRRLNLYASVFVEKGEGHFVSESGTKTRIVPGDIMLLFPRAAAMYYPDGRWSTTWIVWGGSDAEKMESLGYFTPHNPVQQDFSCIVVETHASLSRLMGKEDLASILERKNLILNMLLKLYMHRKKENPPGIFEKNAERIIKKIRGKPEEEYEVHELAKSCSLSMTHFRRLFKEYTGRSPTEFVLASRMAKAKELMSSGRSMKEVASILGYADIFYFMRVFKKVTGMTAGKFRTSHNTGKI